MNIPLVTWILVDDGKIGTYNQCLGLARQLGLSFIFKTVKPRLPWRLLPPNLWFNALLAQEKNHDPLCEPWPNILIAAGRSSMAPALAIHRKAQNCSTIILQNPYMSTSHFTCVIAPAHDRLNGSNVLSIIGSLHDLNKQKIKNAASQYLFSGPTPITTVLLGGDSHHYRYEKEDIKKLSTTLQKIKGHCLITASRRTRPELLQILKEDLVNISHEIWYGKGDNPYYAYLGLADQIIVTEDSVSMATEACSTGKPVYIWELPRRASKSREFYDDLYKGNYAKPFPSVFNGIFSNWKPYELSEMERVVTFIRGKIPALAV